MELDREEILEALKRAALSRPNDAVALALNPKDAEPVPLFESCQGLCFDFLS